MKAKIKRFRPDLRLPEYHTGESAAFDIAVSEDAAIAPREIKLLHTGLIIESPPRHFLMIALRSSTPKKKGLMMAQSIGIVDRDYAGPQDEILLQVYNFTEKPVEVKKGERLAQGLFLPIEQVEWEEPGGQLREESRGGFGSTGN